MIYILTYNLLISLYLNFIKQEIKTQESDLGITFKKNLSEENTKLSFNKDQLKGLDDGQL